MKLDRDGLRERSAWEAAGYRLPAFDRDRMAEETRRRPVWIHFGAGNIFRAFQAALMQRLLETGRSAAGLIVAEGFDEEIIEKVYRPHDNYSILATLKGDGLIEKTVIGSIAESLLLDSGRETDFLRLQEIFRAPSLQMASFTITEKGYSLTDGRGGLLPAVAEDAQAGPLHPQSYLGKVCALLYERYRSGAAPLSLVSMDNCSHNGDKLKEAVSFFAKAWTEGHTAEAGFLDYVNDPQRLSFPWTMIDKITPRPDPQVEELLAGDGVEDMAAVVTARGTWTAPFVNAEECQYLVIEDAFPNGRTPLEDAGVLFASRETVDRAEKMKVCTCLNPLHTALAVFGCLLGYHRISEEMKNPALCGLVRRIGWQEGLPAAADPGILNPQRFLDEVLTKRLPNPFLPDTPQRIATDTSQKLPIRFGETIKTYLSSGHLRAEELEGIPLVLAGWLRYLMGIDDAGQPFAVSPDPLLDTLTPLLAGVRLGGSFDVAGVTAPILRRRDIFGVDLTATVIGEKVNAFFARMTTKKGAVAELLEQLYGGRA